MKKDFDEYKVLSQKIIELLVDNNCSSMYDIKILFNILLGTPYMLEDGFIYRGNFYKDYYDIPENGRIEFVQRYKNISE